MHVRQAGRKIATMTVYDRHLFRLGRPAARTTNPHDAVPLNHDILMGSDAGSDWVDDINVF